jgi:hypothetical protein
LLAQIDELGLELRSLLGEQFRQQFLVLEALSLDIVLGLEAQPLSGLGRL